MGTFWGTDGVYDVTNCWSKIIKIGFSLVKCALNLRAGGVQNSDHFTCCKCIFKPY